MVARLIPNPSLGRLKTVMKPKGDQCGLPEGLAFQEEEEEVLLPH